MSPGFWQGSGSGSGQSVSTMFSKHPAAPSIMRPRPTRAIPAPTIPKLPLQEALMSQATLYSTAAGDVSFSSHSEFFGISSWTGACSGWGVVSDCGVDFGSGTGCGWGAGFGSGTGSGLDGHSGADAGCVSCAGCGGLGMVPPPPSGIGRVGAGLSGHFSTGGGQESSSASAGSGHSFGKGRSQTHSQRDSNSS